MDGIREASEVAGAHCPDQAGPSSGPQWLLSSMSIESVYWLSRFLASSSTSWTTVSKR